MTAMNSYGNQALQHWTRWRPKELAAIPDPQEFFARLGLEVEQEIDDRAEAILESQSHPEAEDYLRRVGRLRMARLDAESEVLRERVLLSPEDEQDETSQDPTGEWAPVRTPALPPEDEHEEMSQDPAGEWQPVRIPAPPTA